MKKISLAVMLFVSVLYGGDTVQLELIDTISIEKKKGDIEAKILFDKEIKGDYSFKGSFKNSKMLSGKNKITINWDTLKKGKSETAATKPFASVLSTTEDILKSQKFNATGDLKILEVDLNTVASMKDTVSDTTAKNDTGTQDAVAGEITTEEKEDNAYMSIGNGKNGAYENGDSGSNGWNSGSEGISESLGGDETEEDEDSVNSIADCGNIIKGNTIQFRKLVETQCINIGSEVPILTVHEGCTPKIDYREKKVYVGTRKIASLEGTEFTVENCKIDYDNPLALKTSFSGCNAVFRKDKIATVQQEQQFYTFDREDIKIGNCVDSSTIYPITPYVETNKQCQPLIDFDGMKVQFGYRKVANFEGSIVEIEPCKFEETKNELVSTFSTCSIRDDFTNKKSVQQEQFYYMFENKKIYVGECQASNIVFNHFMTATTCEPRLVGEDSVVYDKRVAYRDINNIVKYLTKCQPSNDGALKLTEEFCGYEHDHTNHQSYPKTKKWFIDPDTQDKIYITACLKQPFNFPHQEETIRWDYDDIALVGTKHVKLFFTDTMFENQDVYISDNGSEDVALMPQPYVKSVENMKFIKQLGSQRIKKVGNEYKFYSDDTKVIDLGNGLYPTHKGGTSNLTTTKIKDPGYYAKLLVTYNSSCIGDIISISKSYNYTYYHETGDSGYTNTLNFPYTQKSCKKYEYYEKVDQYNLVTNFLRPDGSTFEQDTKQIFRIAR